MNIHLRNIGIIKDSDIQLDGLTVITGKNSSGKTTVSKVLYSLVEATTDVERRASNDKKNYITNALYEVRNALDVFRFLCNQQLTTEESMFDNNSAIGKLFDAEQHHYRSLYSVANEKYIHLLHDELQKFDLNAYIKSERTRKRYAQIVTRTGEIEEFSNLIRDRIRNASEILEKLFEVLESDAELLNYTRESINQTLRSEFSGQIQPISAPNSQSYIELYDNDSLYFKIEVNDNNIVKTKTPVFISSPYSRVLFLDDPFILDRMKGRTWLSRHNENPDSILDVGRISTHDAVLANILRSQKNTTIFEDTVLEKKFSEIKEQINATIPGTFEFNTEGEYYVQDNRKLKFSNLATGSKMFSFVKILIEKGLIDKNTLLIFDEPEAHLHPDWQNQFAEVIVMLVEKLNVKVLLTTHSSNFMLAIDAYMRKYKINAKCNFYQTEYLEDNFVNYKCVNEDMGQIYSDFMEYLSEVKMLRNKYIID